MTQPYDWSNFYNALCQHGPDLLEGIDDNLREVIKEIGTTTDMFWSEGLEASLAEGAAADDLERGVWMALDDWRFNVINQLEASFGISLDWEQVIINENSSVIDQLVDAASIG